MLRTAGFVFIACFALSALALADARKSKPSATVSPASEFDVTTKTTTTTTKGPKTTTTTTTTIAPNTTTVAPNTTTVAPNTTTVAPNTTTVAPNTTTVAPNTTTVNPNTTTVNPNTTTVNPNTTTTATTTVAPTTTAPPSPTPPVGNYSLANGKNETCLKAQVALQIRLANKTFTVQPKETHVNGSCDETRVAVYFNFTQGYINFNFTRDVGNNTVFIDAVAFLLNYPLTGGRLTDARYSGSNTSLHLFPAKIGHSYSCRSDSLYMGNGLYLDVTNDQIQAFNLTKNDFGSPDPCPADKPDYRVAIAVGITLLVLIVVVVVAYLLSRRKRMEGYQSL